MRQLASRSGRLVRAWICGAVLALVAWPLPAGVENRLVWREVARIPDALGFKGMYAGVSASRVILAGGSRFDRPRTEGGRKICGSQIFVRDVMAGDDVPWSIAAETLPTGLAEGSAVTTEAGVVGVGGTDGRQAVKTVFLLSYDPATRSVCHRTLPDLPVAAAGAPALYWRGSLYVAIGDPAGETGIWTLDLAAALAASPDARWRRHSVLPGGARTGPVLVVLETAGVPELFVFGGKKPSSGRAVSGDYLADGWRFDERERAWRPVAPMPHAALLPAAFAFSEGRLAVMGGSDGHDIEHMAELGPAYRLPDRVMIYDATRDRWKECGRMPLGVVAASVVCLGDRWLVAGGEYTPAVRTNRVYEVRVESP